MGIVDDYLNSSSDDTAKPTQKASSGNSLIDQYLNAPEEKAIPVAKSAPVENARVGINEDEAAKRGLSVGPAIKGGANPRDSELIEGIKAAPGKAAGAIGEDFLEGLKTASSGINDISSNKPASGVGKVGLGALQAAGSIVTGPAKELIEKPVTQLTGNPEIGDRASFVATSGIPFVKGAKAAIKATPGNRAFTDLVERIGPENIPEVIRQMKANPRLTPADLSPAVKQDAQTLFVTDGPQINHIANVVQQRTEGAKNAVTGAVNEAMGQTVNAADKLKELQQSARDVGQKQINPALENTGPVNVKPVVDEIDKILKPGVNSVVSNETQLLSPDVAQKLEHVRKYLDDGQSMRSDPQQLHQIQSMLRTTAKDYLNSANGGDRQIGQALMKVRNDIVTAIDNGKLPAKEGAEAAPSYKEALANYRGEKDIDAAFNHGHDAIIANGKSIQNRPEFFKEWVKDATPAELNAAKEGARVAIDTAIRGFRSPATNPASKAVQLSQVEFNRERIEALFGKKEAGSLFEKLEHERQIADTNNKLVEGSQTAMRASSKKNFELPTASDVGKNLLPAAIVEAGSMFTTGTPLVGSALYGTAKLGTKLKDAVATKMQREYNASYSKLALPVEGSEGRAELIRRLEAVASQPPRQSVVRRVSNLARNVAP